MPATVPALPPAIDTATPSVNERKSSDTHRGLVLLNLETIERDETAFLGESTTLDDYALPGAEANTDPSDFELEPNGRRAWPGGRSLADKWHRRPETPAPNPS